MISRYTVTDKGWAWVTLFGATCSNFVVGLLYYSSGIFHVALLERFQGDVSTTALISSVFNSVTCLAGPFVSIVINATNCRFTMMAGGFLTALGYFFSYFVNNLQLLIITYGLTAGLGIGFMCTTCLVANGYCFQKYLGITTGVVSAGGGAGILAGGPLLQVIFDEYSIVGAYLLLAGIALQNVIFGSLFRPSEQEIEHKMVRNVRRTLSNLEHFKKVFNCQIMNKKSFLFLLLSTVLWNISYSAVMIHLANFSYVMGSSKIQAAMLMLWVGLGSFLSRIISGLAVGPETKIDPSVLNFGCLGIMGIVTGIFPIYSDTIWKRTLFSCLFGIYSGALQAFYVPVAIKAVGLTHLSTALGQLWFAVGVATIIGPALAGLIVDKTEKYTLVFVVSGIITGVSMLLAMISTTFRQESVSETSEQDVSNEMLNGLPSMKQNLKGSGLLYGSTPIVGSSDIMVEVFSSQLSLNKKTLNSNVDQTIKNQFERDC